ncbi:membrane-spanning 4-domains subfamily A member 15-like [Pituophis catenifer annectens]|uniref:membrane-spanning 4-domains subfamily A member 15-like n=1 Tax=Pituophis catenifer annectens TaxID=94852 RepID=UPI00399434BE
MASETTLFLPSNGANMIQTTPGLPSVAPQASGAIPYPQYGTQQLGIPTSAPQQVPQKGPLERFFKAEPKVLGAIQIMIGLIQIGFGAISFCLLSAKYITLSGFGGYPFWGGIFSVGYGFAIVLLLLSLLEFCIAVSLAHFGCQATCRSGAQPTMVFMPYQVIGGGEVAAEPNPLPPPPTYDNVITKSQ